MALVLCTYSIMLQHSLVVLHSNSAASKGSLWVTHAHRKEHEVIKLCRTYVNHEGSEWQLSFCLNLLSGGEIQLLSGMVQFTSFMPHWRCCLPLFTHLSARQIAEVSCAVFLEHVTRFIQGTLQPQTNSVIILNSRSGKERRAV